MTAVWPATPISVPDSAANDVSMARISSSRSWVSVLLGPPVGITVINAPVPSALSTGGVTVRAFGIAPIVSAIWL